MTTKAQLVIAAYAPALVDGADRALAVVRGMELARPGLCLKWMVSKAGRPVELPQRDAWISEGIKNGGFPLVCNGDESYPVTIAGSGRPARLSPGGQSLLEVHANVPQDEASITTAAAVVAAVSEGAKAFWGHVTPEEIMLVIADQMGPKLYGPPKPPRGLPALKLPARIASPEIPHFLGWLNYWSVAAARAIGFPDPARDADLLSRARRTESGGWVVRLTDAPLDLDVPSHLEALRRAYERFPAIGGRSAP